MSGIMPLPGETSPTPGIQAPNETAGMLQNLLSMIQQSPGYQRRRPGMVGRGMLQGPRAQMGYKGKGVNVSIGGGDLTPLLKMLGQGQGTDAWPETIDPSAYARGNASGPQTADYSWIDRALSQMGNPEQGSMIGRPDYGPDMVGPPSPDSLTAQDLYNQYMNSGGF